MPKVHIAKFDAGRLGGGWTFARELYKGLGDLNGSYEESPIYFITSPSMVEREEVKTAKADGKYIVLRVDNIIRNSRNRNTGMSRMRDMSELADITVYQSHFAMDLLDEWVKPNKEAVILNACDQQIFNPFGREESVTARYLYSRYNRDETKNWEMARYIFERAYRENSQSRLSIIGQYSDELREYNFDFYRGEHYQYMGVIADPRALADIYRDSDYLIYTYFNDACSNTLIEALSCGCDMVDPYDMLMTGGSAEIVMKWHKEGREYFDTPRMIAEYLEVFNEFVL